MSTVRRGRRRAWAIAGVGGAQSQSQRRLSRAQGDSDSPARQWSRCRRGGHYSGHRRHQYRTLRPSLPTRRIRRTEPRRIPRPAHRSACSELGQLPLRA
eukprot:2143341-Prymnesium_polylepis.1